MKVVIQGQDWSEINPEKNNNISALEYIKSMLPGQKELEDDEQSEKSENLPTDELKEVNSLKDDAYTSSSDVNKANIASVDSNTSKNGDTPDDDKDNVKDESAKDNWESLGYFKRLTNANDKTISPYNLGLYQKISDKNEEHLWATQYVGIVPLLSLKEKNNKNIDSQTVIKISSRFDISPTEMVGEVLSGMDFYENPNMLTTKSYSAHEWKKLNDTYKDEKGKILFGLVNGIGKIDLSQKVGGDGEEVDETDVGIVEAFGVFEIIDFVNKAKDLCKKNLKKQSQRVEENLNCKVKGRILVQKQIKYNAARGQLQKTYCAYNKMSEDIKENQIIKYALHLCQKKQGIGDALAEDIRYCMNTLRGVPLRKCSASDFVGLKNNGAYKQYKETLESAKKVINRYSTSYNDSFSEVADKEKDINDTEKVSLKSFKVLPYFIDMNLLFEYYCRALFRKAVDRYNNDNNERIQLELESAKDANRLLFEVDYDYWKKYVLTDKDDESNNDGLVDDTIKEDHRYFMAKYIPDIVINYSKKGQDKKVAIVFDAKYSDVKSQPKRSRTHQVMFYMKAMNCDYGGLISPAKLKRDNEGGLDKSNYEDEKIESGKIKDYREIKLHINHHVRDGNDKVEGDDGPILYHAPLLFKKDVNDIRDDNDERTVTEFYVDRLVKCLERIAEKIGEKEEQEKNQEKKEDLINNIIKIFLERKHADKKDDGEVWYKFKREADTQEFFEKIDELAVLSGKGSIHDIINTKKEETKNE